MNIIIDSAQRACGKQDLCKFLFDRVYNAYVIDSNIEDFLECRKIPLQKMKFSFFDKQKTKKEVSEIFLNTELSILLGRANNCLRASRLGSLDTVFLHNQSFYSSKAYARIAFEKEYLFEKDFEIFFQVWESIKNFGFFDSKSTVVIFLKNNSKENTEEEKKYTELVLAYYKQDGIKILEYDYQVARDTLIFQKIFEDLQNI